MKQANLIRNILEALLLLAVVIIIAMTGGCAKRSNDPVITILSEQQAKQARQSIYGGI